MKKISIYGIVLLTFLGLIFFSMRFVSSKDISSYSLKDSIQQGNGNTEVIPNTENKCGKCCCNKKCCNSKCSRQQNKDEEVPIGKNPNLNNADTIKSNIVPQEDNK